MVQKQWVKWPIMWGASHFAVNFNVTDCTQEDTYHWRGEGLNGLLRVQRDGLSIFLTGVLTGEQQTLQFWESCTLAGPKACTLFWWLWGAWLGVERKRMMAEPITMIQTRKGSMYHWVHFHKNLNCWTILRHTHTYTCRYTPFCYNVIHIIHELHHLKLNWAHKLCGEFKGKL